MPIAPEMFAAFQLKAKISDNVVVFIVPLIYVMMLYASGVCDV